MKKTYFSLILLIIAIIIFRYAYLYFYKHEYYYESYLKVTNKIVYGLNAPRGRILDRNGKILVDNIGINTIVFHKLDGIDTIEVANTLAPILPNLKEA